MNFKSKQNNSKSTTHGKNFTPCLISFPGMNWTNVIAQPAYLIMLSLMIKFVTHNPFLSHFIHPFIQNILHFLHCCLDCLLAFFFVVGKMNIPAHKFKCIMRHCILNEWNWDTVQCIHPHFTLIASTPQVSTWDHCNSNSNPCHDKVWCYWIFGSYIICMVARTRWELFPFGPLMKKNKEICFTSFPITITMFSFHHPYIKSIVHNHFFNTSK